MDVIGFGEGSVDFVHVVAHLPDAERSKAEIVASYTAYGGQVATAMAAGRALGLSARYLGPVGNDANGAALVEALSSRGVDVSAVLRRHVPQRFAIILVERGTGDRAVLWRRDPGLNVEPGDLAGAMIAGCRVVHVDGSDAAASLRLAELAVSAGALVTTDIDAASGGAAQLLAAATTPIVAEHVPQELTGEGDLERALRRLRRPHQRLVCVTLGRRGAAVLDGETLLEVPAPEVRAVDTTGAGDIFRAGFIYGLVRDWPARRILTFANAAAALSCTREGAIQSVPTLDEVERLL